MLETKGLEEDTTTTMLGLSVFPLWYWYSQVSHLISTILAPDVFIGPHHLTDLTMLKPVEFVAHTHKIIITSSPVPRTASVSTSAHKMAASSLPGWQMPIWHQLLTWLPALILFLSWFMCLRFSNHQCLLTQSILIHYGCLTRR